MAFKFGANSVIGLTRNPNRTLDNIGGTSVPFNITTATFNNIDVYGAVRFRQAGKQLAQGGVGETFGIHIGGARFPATEEGNWKRFSFITDSPAAVLSVNYANALQPSYLGTGWSGMTYGLHHRGVALDTDRVGLTTVNRFPFSAVGSTGIQLSIANLSTGRYFQSAGGNGMQNNELGISVGGYITAPFINADNIETIPLTLSGEYSAIAATLSPTTRYGATMITNSSDAGFTMGGSRGPVTPANFLSTTTTSGITKYPFASLTTSELWSSLTIARASGGGVMSSTHGYSMAGLGPTMPTVTTTNNVEKFPFAASSPVAVATASTPARSQSATFSSSTTGFMLGGTSTAPIAPQPSNAHVLTNLKLPFASDTALATHATNPGTTISTYGQATCVV